jgi:hypothetical protein
MLQSIIKAGLIGTLGAFFALPLVYAGGAEAAPVQTADRVTTAEAPEGDEDDGVAQACTASFQCPLSKPYCRNGQCTSNPFGREEGE